MRKRCVPGSFPSPEEPGYEATQRSDWLTDSQYMLSQHNHKYLWQNQEITRKSPTLFRMSVDRFMTPIAGGCMRIQ